MCPKILRPRLLYRGVRVEVLQLRECEEGGCNEDVDAQYFDEALVVEVEGVLEGELAVAVGVHDAGVFDDVDVFGGPAGGDVGYYDLL